MTAIRSKDPRGQASRSAEPGPASSNGAELVGRPLSEWISLAEAADELPRRRGRKIHLSTLYRWTNAGCRGVRLEFAMIGATRCTTRQALADFFGRLTEASGGGAVKATRPGDPAGREAAERANRLLDEAGI